MCVDALASVRAGPQEFAADLHLGFVCNQRDVTDALTSGTLAVSTRDSELWNPGPER
jgi:hypothetical protein